VESMNASETLVEEVALASRLGDQLATHSFGRLIRWYETVSSTNSVAAEWALNDAPDGAVVCAEIQTAGRGRFERQWISPASENLTFSIILFPGLPADRLGMISVAFSVAVADLLKADVGPGRVDIKWPNDILLDGAKVCGMLQESAFPSIGGPRRVIFGLGLNVNQLTFPEDLSSPATSMRLVTNREYDRVELFASLLKLMEDAYRAIHTGRTNTIRSRYEAKLVSLGRQVTFLRLADRQDCSGIVTVIDNSGGLVISTRSGTETVFAGDVSMRPR
jgi:BirA family biotin operon repressor/biotin-[acetyl-CoA-carboxylase] ligase